MQNIKKYAPYGVVFLLIGSLVTYNIKVQQAADKNIKQLETLLAFQQDSVTILNNQIGQVVTQSHITITQSKEVIKTLSDSIFLLKAKDAKQVKSVSGLARVQQSVRIDTVFIPFDSARVTVLTPYPAIDSIYRQDSLLSNHLTVPQHFQLTTPRYMITGNVLKEGVKIASVSISDTASIRVITQRPKGLVKRLLQPNQEVVQIIHSNPLFETTGIQSMLLKRKPSTWNRLIKPTLAALATGLIVHYLK